MFFKNLFANRWTKIIIAVALCILIAAISSVATYFFILRNDKAEPAIFSEMVESLKQQAHNAMTLVSEEAIIAVGEKLKEILASEYAPLLTNDTFNSGAFLVEILDYPLQDGSTVRRIKYIMKSNEDSERYEESRFFLQYIGETEFFNNIEYSPSNEEDFQVFENKDGVFAFSLISKPNYTGSDSNKELIKYSSDIYVLHENEFSVEKYVAIPLQTFAGNKLRLLQQGGTIKGVISDNRDLYAECFFVSDKLSFEIPKGDFESEPVDYDVPALLLGLSDSKGNLRTLYIHQEDRKIYSDEYSGQIIFPRQNKLFSLKNYVLDEEIIDEESGFEISNYRSGKLDFQKLLCSPLGTDLTADFDKIFNPKTKWGYYGVTDIPLYVGADYICYIQNEYYSGGGTYSRSADNIRFDKLDNLSKFTADYGDDGMDEFTLISNFKETTLADLIYGVKVKELYQSDIRTYGGNLNPYVDLKQLSIKRNLGKWSLMLPVMDEYYHPGNGSNGNTITTFVAYSNSVPTFLATNSEAMETIGVWSYWNAKDRIKFPESKAFLAQYDYDIGIGNREAGNNFIESTDIKIPILIDEYIVSINFTNNDTKKAWEDELKRLGAKQ
jgi:hypothetical protein